MKLKGQSTWVSCHCLSLSLAFLLGKWVHTTLVCKKHSPEVQGGRAGKPSPARSTPFRSAYLGGVSVAVAPPLPGHSQAGVLLRKTRPGALSLLALHGAV